MHVDVEALWPIIAGNRVQGVISLDALHGVCVAAALMALACLADRPAVQRRIALE